MSCNQAKKFDVIILGWIKTSPKPEVKKYFDYNIDDLVAAIKS
ncbi:MAG: hypothetical protein AAF383_13365 [Cyanobacteria bacterium P01_A01_bin.83]